jgi:hypothetical protein
MNNEKHDMEIEAAGNESPTPWRYFGQVGDVCSRLAAAAR